MSTIGIDFGTTNSVVAAYTPSGSEAIDIDSPPADWADLGFGRVLPTVFGLGPQGETLFGWEAKTLAHGERLQAVKRLFQQEVSVTLDGQEFLVETIATMLFGHMKAKVLESGLSADRAVVTIPANSRGLARYRTKLCAQMAKLQVLALINEPTAAAMAYSARMPFDQRVMVVDWGGGTLDVTILEAQAGVFIEQASKGIQRLGGLDLDARVAQHIAAATPGVNEWSALERHLFRLAVEKAKVRLSERDFTNVDLPRGGFHRLDRPTFDDSVRGLVERVRQPIEQTLQDLGAAPADIDAVILVGGTCKVPLVREFIADLMGKEPAAGVDPMTAVAEGAAIAAAILSGEIEDNDFFVATEHALGTFALDRTGEMRFSTIIPRNHKLPARATESYTPAMDEAASISLRVVEGDPEHEDYTVLQTVDVPLDTGRLSAQDKSFDVTYEYDLDGILNVNVEDRLSGRTLTQSKVGFGIAPLSPSDRVRIAEGSEAAVAEGRISPAAAAPVADPKVAELLQRARKDVIPYIDEDKARPLRELADALERAGDAERPDAVLDLELALLPYSYLF
ncbi:Hsp70 family protein [Motilibacter deserti]|uniref:Hsp70 family protein n=1 Tax=Motilibacter deserti TaxID=2714956 RepID=A0ABX0GRJ0_9ACTN|nr:Hsp70 family protein [Motilibacter deserti]